MNGVAGWTGSPRICGTRCGRFAAAPASRSWSSSRSALGIGGTTAVFSVIQAVLLAPLPYEEPGQLVRFYQQEPDRPGTRRVFSVPTSCAARACRVVRGHRRARNYRETGLDLIGGGRAGTASHPARHERLLRDARATPSRPGAGDEGFESGATTAGAPRVVLSDAIWRAHFAADPASSAATIQLAASLRDRRRRAAGSRRSDRRRRGRVASVRPRERHQRGEQLARRPSAGCGTASASRRARRSLPCSVGRGSNGVRCASGAGWPPCRFRKMSATARDRCELLLVAVGLVLLVGGGERRQPDARPLDRTGAGVRPSRRPRLRPARAWSVSFWSRAAARGPRRPVGLVLARLGVDVLQRDRPRGAPTRRRGRHST